jgi:ring-1,2-phenylacetyl-CoA epoxidase subunit PaaA
VDQTVPQIEYLGLDLPDPGIKWNEERGHYDYSDPDWTEFFNVIKGNGPCNVDRLSDRKKAWDDGQWVRDGLLAHARKKAATKVAAE